MEIAKIHTYRDLIVWQKSIKLVVAVYKLTNNFPKNEMYALSSQMQRAAVSIPSNIAEGRHRGTRKDFAQFLRIAFASGAELETQIEIAKQLQYITPDVGKESEDLLLEIMKMLNIIISKMSRVSKS